MTSIIEAYQAIKDRFWDHDDSPEVLAERARLSSAGIRRAVGKKGNPTVKTLEKIEKALDEPKQKAAQ